MFRTGRFVCELQGRRVKVTDTAAAGGEITAKVTEWRELLDAIAAADEAHQLQRRQQ